MVLRGLGLADARPPIVGVSLRAPPPKTTTTGSPVLPKAALATGPGTPAPGDQHPETPAGQRSRPAFGAEFNFGH